MYNYHPLRLAKSNMLKQYFSHCVNDVSDGSPSRIRRVLRISFGMTILPKSSTRRTMPVAFISFPLLVVNSSGSVCRFWGIMREPVSKVKRQGLSRLHHFNPRSPWGERRHIPNLLFQNQLFQSTLPVGGATGHPAGLHTGRDDFNPRSPWGERRRKIPAGGDAVYFNPRSPWGERHNHTKEDGRTIQFQSTLPVGGATCGRQPDGSGSYISIHAPRGGERPATPIPDAEINHFNPRSPWGERPCDNQRIYHKVLISIHAPRGGSDITIQRRTGGQYNFNPRSPWGERQAEYMKEKYFWKFQSTLPVGGATRNI